MNEYDPILDAPPSEEEAERARHLAEALESGASGSADPHALSVVRLLESLSQDLPGDELALSRARKELVARASRMRFLRVGGRFAAAAAVVIVALSGAILLRGPGRPSVQLLEQREGAARAAIAAISPTGTGDLGETRLRSQMDDLRTERFASAIRSERLATLMGQTEEEDSSKEGRDKMKPSTAAPVPGGVS